MSKFVCISIGQLVKYEISLINKSFVILTLKDNRNLAGDAVSPVGDLLASPNFRICGTTRVDQQLRPLTFSYHN